MRLWRAVAQAQALLGEVGLACSCGVTSRCPLVPVAPNSSALVGEVVDIFPASPDKVNADLVAFVAGRSSEEPASETERAFFRTFWSVLISSREAKRLEPASPAGEAGNLFGQGFSASSRRVRLRVVEGFSHAVENKTFEVFVGRGGGADCSPSFMVGKRYIVLAAREDDTGRWLTSSCMGTVEIESKPGIHQSQLLADLRAAKNRQLRPPHVYGIAWRAKPEGQRVWLAGQSFERTTKLDRSGRFAFENLPPGRYRIWLGLRAGDGLTVDLTQFTCQTISRQLN